MALDALRISWVITLYRVQTHCNASTFSLRIRCSKKYLSAIVLLHSKHIATHCANCQRIAHASRCVLLPLLQWGIAAYNVLQCVSYFMGILRQCGEIAHALSHFLNSPHCLMFFLRSEKAHQKGKLNLIKICFYASLDKQVVCREEGQSERGKARRVFKIGAAAHAE